MVYSIGIGKRKHFDNLIEERQFLAAYHVFEDHPWVIEGKSVPWLIDIAYFMDTIGMNEESNVFKAHACAEASDSEIEILTRHWIGK